MLSYCRIAKNSIKFESFRVQKYKNTNITQMFSVFSALFMLLGETLKGGSEVLVLGPLPNLIQMAILFPKFHDDSSIRRRIQLLTEDNERNTNQTNLIISCVAEVTRHRASTSVYSLTVRVRVMLP